MTCDFARAYVQLAQVLHNRTQERLARPCYTDYLSPVSIWADDELYAASSDHTYQVIAIYTQAATKFMVASVEAVRRLMGFPPSGNNSDLYQVSDILKDPERFCPPLTVAADAVRVEARHEIGEHNRQLIDAHNTLLEQIALVLRDGAPEMFDHAEVPVHSSTLDVHPQLALSMHEYARLCSSAADLIWDSPSGV